VIYLCNYSFLLANLLLSFYNNYFTEAYAKLALASFYYSNSLFAFSLAIKVLSILINNPLTSAKALTVF